MCILKLLIQSECNNTFLKSQDWRGWEAGIQVSVSNRKY